MASNPEQDFVLKTIKSRDVHFVRFWFTDVLGSMKSFAVIPSELEDAFADGMGFDGSCIEGFCRTAGVRHAGVSRRLHVPGAARGARKATPWRACSAISARPMASPSRAIRAMCWQRVVGKAARTWGTSFNVGPEVEYFYFKDAEGTELLGPWRLFRSDVSSDYASDLRRDTRAHP